MSLPMRLGCRRRRSNPTTCNVCHVDNAYYRRRRHTHSCYMRMSPAPTTGVDDIPTHATGCRQRLPLATYYPPMLCTTPFQWIAGRLPLKTRLTICTNAHTNTTSYAHRTWRQRTENIQAQALSAMQAQGPFASVHKAPLSSLDATHKKVQRAPFPPQCQCKRN
jgi:hypothetical protein